MGASPEEEEDAAGCNAEEGAMRAGPLLLLAAQATFEVVTVVSPVGEGAGVTGAPVTLWMAAAIWRPMSRES